ncbi:prolyl-tRNA synthetase [Candidatus Parcubacteria bacterium]|uniref:Proline--tRNA ligase n=1 Tax=Candidatus Kaiserbacteria bacterium CG10_big_fil_rev_8_21_14_0_10_47_16 TaxID=1974608 RepID=A0A2H0UEY4_9BACT|nr:prolyl-tRNA synthetase [Candidatus Parcubacteria bacterium]PIR84335.1 MAG: prolyl-tRNA synthetase [Candidatus Kaiserbacteria bacterium CG10_big_fil_rev_8_21_14_0_10_47_16]
MRQSQLFTKTRKEAPSDEVSKNAQLLIRAGYVHKEMAGVYDLLPLGLRVIEKIKGIVREEMNRVGGQELLMSSLQRKELWEQTDRWSDETVDVWFKSELAVGGEVGFGWSHEEPIMDMMQQYVASYKDLPASVYQFQTKLRNELRAKSGIMRGREFIMKDMYSLHATEEDLNEYYEKVKQAYLVIFKRLGLGADTYVTFASGGAFTKFSHEFQTVCDAGEDVLYVHRGKNIAVNEEVLDEAVKELGLEKDQLEKVKSAEIGNIFNFGTDKAAQMGITFASKEGSKDPVFLASYGIGITRALGVIVEKFADEKGIVWPESVAPFTVHLVGLNSDDDAVRDYTDGLYTTLTEEGVEVLYDDRDARTGEKFADSDLIGIPYRVVVSKKTQEEGRFEVVTRKTGEVRFLTEEELLNDFMPTGTEEDND